MLKNNISGLKKYILFKNTRFFRAGRWALLIILVFVLNFIISDFSFAQGMMGNTMMVGDDTITESDDGHTAREEAEGKEIWGKLQVEELQCENLTDENFGALGEYFMGQMMGDSHEAMNNAMIQMMGEKGEEQSHIAMGKRMSECEPNAPVPQNMMNMMQMMAGKTGSGMMGDWSDSSALSNFSDNPMMQMMMGSWSNPSALSNSNNPMSMMNFGNNPMSWGFGFFGWIFMLFWWVAIIAGVIALIRWLANQSRGSHNHEKSPLEILKERYAAGEIDKKEFEEKKKDLS